MRILITILLTLAVAVPARPCSFCADGASRRQTLRQLCVNAHSVIHGTLENAKPDPSGLGGQTDLRVNTAMKTDKVTQGQTRIVLPRYIPTVGTAPKEYLAFCETTDGKVDLISGIPATAKVVDYLKDANKLDNKNAVVTLGFFFKHLHDDDATVANDSFLELARATDADLVKASVGFDRVLLKQWLTDPHTPVERLGVYAMLLGFCGKRDDAATLQAMLQGKDLPDRVVANLGGILAGLTLLDKATGWKTITSLVSANTQPLDVRLGAISAIRFFQTTQTESAKTEILAAFKEVLTQGDFADLVMEDLRRWGWWDMSADIFAVAAKSTAPLTKRAAIRYALSCKDDVANAYVAKVRVTDGRLVDEVEEGLKLYSIPDKIKK